MIPCFPAIANKRTQSFCIFVEYATRPSIRLLLQIPLNDAAFFAYSSSTADTTLSLHLRVFEASDQSISHTMKSHFCRSECDQGGISRREGVITRDTTKLSTV